MNCIMAHPPASNLEELSRIIVSAVFRPIAKMVSFCWKPLRLGDNQFRCVIKSNVAASMTSRRHELGAAEVGTPGSPFRLQPKKQLFLPQCYASGNETEKEAAQKTSTRACGRDGPEIQKSTQ
jgi:hypothetical protein